MIGVPPSSLQASSLPAEPLRQNHLGWPERLSLPAFSAFLTLGPVFLQAPLVRMAPMAAALGTIPLLLGALSLANDRDPGRRNLGLLLVGFAGSWLGGSLFWGWFRLYPIWHLPIEGFALPLALGGLQTRWRIAAWFYLASLLGTAVTDALIAATGLMPLWPKVLEAQPEQAASLLQEAALALFHPLPLLATSLAALWILQLARQLWAGDGARRMASAALASTLLVDAVFLAVALLAPKLSGLI